MTHIETMQALLENIDSVALKDLKRKVSAAIFDVDNFEDHFHDAEYDCTLDPLGLAENELGLTANALIMCLHYKESKEFPLKSIRPLSFSRDRAVRSFDRLVKFKTSPRIN